MRRRCNEHRERFVQARDDNNRAANPQEEAKLREESEEDAFSELIPPPSAPTVERLRLYVSPSRLSIEQQLHGHFKFNFTNTQAPTESE